MSTDESYDSSRRRVSSARLAMASLALAMLPTPIRTVERVYRKLKPRRFTNKDQCPQCHLNLPYCKCAKGQHIKQGEQ